MCEAELKTQTIWDPSNNDTTKRAAERASEHVSRAELEEMRAGERRKRAQAAGVTEEQMQEAYKSPDRKAAIIELIIDAEKSKEASAKAALHNELAQLSLHECFERAEKAGATEEELEHAEEAAEPRVPAR